MKINKRLFEATKPMAVTLGLTAMLATSSAYAVPKPGVDAGAGVTKSTAAQSDTKNTDKESAAGTEPANENAATKSGGTDKSSEVSARERPADATAEQSAEQSADQSSDQSAEHAGQTTVSVNNDDSTDAELGTKITAKIDQENARLQNLAADHFDLAKHYSHKFDWEMSEVELEAAIMCVPTLKAAHRDYCVVSLLRGQPMRSLAELMMVVGLGDPIPLNEEEKVALNKKAAKLHYQKGLNYGISRKWKKATPEFQWALSYAPESAAITHSLAFSYAAAGDFENAEKLYLKAVALDPSNSYSHADFAVLLSEHGDQQKAMKELATAISLAPDVAALHVDMAWLAEANGDLKTAESEFHHAVQLSPKHAGLWSHLGRVEERLGKASDARTAYSEALAVDPGDDEAKARLSALEKTTAPKASDSTESPEPTPSNPDQSKKQS